MAGDWIKMRADLQTHPKVVRIASALDADRLRVIGGLHAVWCLFDAHSVDGSLCGYTPESLDSLVGFPGFTRAMESAEWIEIRGEALSLPRFDEHNGQSAKRRASESQRKRNERNGVRKVSASDADKKRTREEKRREEKKEEPTARRRSVKQELASDWQPEPAVVEQMKAECPEINQDRALIEFREYWCGVKEKKADWNSTYRNRIRFLDERRSHARPATQGRRNETRPRPEPVPDFPFPVVVLNSGNQKG
jgi:hypothetical protein